ncbi:MAG: hypothetical protein Q4A45_07790 [Clostridia bacterium]|mgnify:FL=1|nr:hypothetical protein [Clostridia bacterium]
MKKTNDYPIILIHGFLCWGTESKINQFMPCMGMWNGNARVAIMEEGVRCYTPHIGPFSSMWDRACILYAMIKGGRVDYGEVHSKRYGHERFGETYPGYVPNWGELDEKGRIQKVSLIGHSFGAPTVRTLINLLAEGDAEERIAGGDVSPLFEGGKQRWIHTCTTLAGTHNGVTLPDAARPLVKPVSKVVFGLGNLVSGTALSRVYDFHLDRFGISSMERHIPFNKEAVNHLANLERDNIFYELSTKGAIDCMKDYKDYDNIYYFSYYGRRTYRKFGIEIPSSDIWFPLRVLSPFECLYKDSTHGVDWQPNDGIVNVPAAHHPEGHDFVDYKDGMEIKPGIWNVMPEEWKDHTSYMGIGETAEDYHKFFKALAVRSMTLPVVE